MGGRGVMMPVGSGCGGGALDGGMVVDGRRGS